jgi:hypothetical protein
LLFSRDTKDAPSGEFLVWHIEGDEAWPPACPKERVRAIPNRTDFISSSRRTPGTQCLRSF